MSRLRFLPVCLLTAGLLSHPAVAQDTPSLSYSLGVLLGSSLERQGFSEVDAKELMQGITDTLAGKPRIDAQSAGGMVQQYQREQQEAAAKVGIEAGQAFLDNNARRNEVTRLPSGLQYEVLRAGDGRKPGADDRVTVHYTGTLTDGTVFDSSVQRGEPATFGVSQVIKGWTEALQLMPEGSKWKLYIPQDLAYGARQVGDRIPPYSVLVFEVELLKVN